MKSSQLIYLGTIFFFAGLGNYALWRRNGRVLKKHWRFVLGFALLSMPVAYWDAVAQRWGAYQYNPNHTLYVQIHGGETETYFFLGGIVAAIAGATIVYAKREDIYHSRHGYKKKYNRKQRSLRLRKVFGAAGASLELDLLAKLQSS